MSPGYLRPASLDEAVSTLDRLGDDAKVLAGGTTLVLLLQEGFVAPDWLVEIGRLEALRGIREESGHVVIGAATTQWEVESSALVRARLPVLAATVARVATVRIRSMATLGGNVVHGDPRLDPAAVLLALDAVVRLKGVDGERRLALGDFFVDELETAIEPGELLVAIEVPWPADGSRSTYRKLVGQTTDDYGTVNVAARIDLDETGEQCRDARLVLGGVGPTPIRVHAAEAVLRDGGINRETIREAADLARQAADPVDDLRGSAAFKRDLVAVEVRRALESLAPVSPAAS
jgi:aerobic carbon-monoxide dehydrogenase medium subunit